MNVKVSALVGDIFDTLLGKKNGFLLEFIKEGIMHRGKFLIIDDEEDVRDVVKMYLE